MFSVLNSAASADIQILREVNFKFSRAVVILLHSRFEKVDDYRQDILNN